MDIKFKIDKKKLQEKHADGVNLMFNEMSYHMCYGGAIGIINDFMIDFSLNSDVETYVIDKSMADDLKELLVKHRSGIEFQLNSIILEKGYDLQAEIIVETAIQNIEESAERYGLMLTFETIKM